MSSSSTSNVCSTSKHQKIIRSTDRISNLPECLISKILSLLSTKEAVATSVLSKNWIFAWTSITNLDFSDSHLFLSKFRRMSAAEKMERKINFVKYINRIFLLLNSSTINNFYLFFQYIIDSVSVNNWIVAAVRRDVRDLYLNLVAPHGELMELPRSLYYCNTLEALVLKGSFIFTEPKNASIVFPKLRFLRLENVECGKIPKTDSICFPVLKILHLIRLTYIDDSITRLLDNCPILEDLLITRCSDDIDTTSEIGICAPALRTAEIEFEDYELASLRKVQVVAPALEYLNIKNWTPLQEIIIKNQYSLNKAHVGLDYYEDSMAEQQQNITKLLKAVNRVKYLTVDTGIEMAWTIPFFSNLIKLEIEMNCCDISVLQGFLQNSIKLHHLVYRKKGCHDYDNDLRWSEACDYVETCLTECGGVPKCLISTLKMIEIDWVSGCDGDIALIKYILKNAILLDKIIIRVDIDHDQDRKYKLLQRISMFPRGSASCEVEFL